MAILDLDIHTVINLLCIGNLAALATLVAYQGRSVKERSILFYIGGAFAQALAWYLLSLRGVASDFFSVYIGNSILLASFNLEGLAICSVEGRNPRLDLAFLVSGLAGITSFCILSGSPNGRVATASLATIAPFALIGVAMFQASGGHDEGGGMAEKGAQDPRPARRRLRARRHLPWRLEGAQGGLRAYIGIASFLYCPLLLLRAVTALVRGPSFSLMTPGLVQSIAFLPLFISMIIGPISFILLLKKRSDRLLRESEEKYRTLVEKASEAIIILQDEKIAFANSRCSELLGLEEGSILGRHFADFIWPEDRERIMANHRRRLNGHNMPGIYDFRLVGAEGEAVWVSISATLIRWRGRLATLNLFSDITARKHSEERIAKLLAEKEILLREVHHRVKNNLAMVKSLLALQSETAGGKDPATVLIDASNRMESLVQLYDLLHKSGSVEEMPVRDFFEPLVHELAAVFTKTRPPRIDLDLGDFSLDVDRLTTLGIIVNEIVTNSMKYAWTPSGLSGEPRSAVELRSAGAPRFAGDGAVDPAIRLSASLSGGRVRFVCGDNGRGLPPGFDPADSSGLGTQLVGLLAQQLKAELSVESPVWEAVPGSAGTRYTIEFSAERPAPAVKP